MPFPVPLIDCPHTPTLQLGAIGTTAPTSAPTGGAGLPVDAPMAIVGNDGKVSLSHNKSGLIAFTIFYWNKTMNAWCLPGPDQTTSQITVQQYATATYRLPPGAKIFVQADTALNGTTELCFLGGVLDANGRLPNFN